MILKKLSTCLELRVYYKLKKNCEITRRNRVETFISLSKVIKN